jgi:hypothetical protein
MNAYTLTTAGIGRLAPISSTATNEQIARQIVESLKTFRTAAPFGPTWTAFAVAEILTALNAASKRRGRAHG